jgi:hypothetical protein
MLTGLLDFQRATLAAKCEGLSDAQLRQRAVPPSALSLLGLVRHMAEMEDQFYMVLTGEPFRGIWAAGPDRDVDAAFREVETASVEEAFLYFLRKTLSMEPLPAALPERRRSA